MFVEPSFSYNWSDGTCGIMLGALGLSAPIVNQLVAKGATRISDRIITVRSSSYRLNFSPAENTWRLQNTLLSLHGLVSPGGPKLACTYHCDADMMSNSHFCIQKRIKSENCSTACSMCVSFYEVLQIDCTLELAISSAVRLPSA